MQLWSWRTLGLPNWQTHSSRCRRHVIRRTTLASDVLLFCWLRFFSNRCFVAVVVIFVVVIYMWLSLSCVCLENRLFIGCSWCIQKYIFAWKFLDELTFNVAGKCQYKQRDFSALIYWYHQSIKMRFCVACIAQIFPHSTWLQWTSTFAVITFLKSVQRLYFIQNDFMPVVKTLCHYLSAKLSAKSLSIAIAV